MNEPPSAPANDWRAADATHALPPKVTLGTIFGAFLLIGATSFGGGVVAYLRSSLVGRHGWLDDEEFVELLSISQALPGLNATNQHGGTCGRPLARPSRSGSGSGRYLSAGCAHHVRRGGDVR